MIDNITIDRLDLRPKLILAFVLVASLVAVTGAIGYASVGVVDEQAHLIAEDGVKMDASAESIVAIQQQQAAILNAQLGAEDAREEFTAADESFNEHAQQLEETGLCTDQDAKVDMRRSRHEYYTELDVALFEA